MYQFLLAAALAATVVTPPSLGRVVSIRLDDPHAEVIDATNPPKGIVCSTQRLVPEKPEVVCWKVYELGSGVTASSDITKKPH
ncbi:MAG: hypothetical protein AB203_01015 [Parcubacteria bacterium C7867-008]|nr:MAG: hypothetical protein AB203_01015 [Parcubacteria bacterium C7867-008]